MSICISAYLGTNLEDLQERVLSSFKEIGLEIELHPEADLLDCSSKGELYVAVLHTPSWVKRLTPEMPLITGFGYGVVRRDNAAADSPRGVRKYTYGIHTRTSSGRSLSDYFIQAFICTILAKESGGSVIFDGDDHAMQGETAVQRIVDELQQANNNRSAFDMRAFVFTGWQPIDSPGEFSLYFSQPINSPTPIVLSPQTNKQKLSIIEVLGLGMMLTFVILTLLYS